MERKLPKHIAIVMDGNGRWAQERGLPRFEGHKAGIKTVKDIIKRCMEKKIPTLSLFAFSSENWSRPKEEVDFLMSLFVEAIDQELKVLHEHGICLRFVGDRTPLSSELKSRMINAEKFTINNCSLILNIAVNYGGRWDIVQAAKSLALMVKQNQISVDEINEAKFSSELSLGELSDPDFLIRTSGELRISNFFLWQFAYTELFFSKINWPDFTVEDFDKSLDCFASRNRRYGKLDSKLEEIQNV